MKQCPKILQENPTDLRTKNSQNSLIFLGVTPLLLVSMHNKNSIAQCPMVQGNELTGSLLRKVETSAIAHDNAPAQQILPTCHEYTGTRQTDSHPDHKRLD